LYINAIEQRFTIPPPSPHEESPTINQSIILGFYDTVNSMPDSFRKSTRLPHYESVALDLRVKFQSWLLTVLDESNISGLFSEALTADVEAVFADETGLVGADTALSRSLAVSSWS